MAKVCVVHQKKSEGLPIKNDPILNTIRRVKQMLRVSTGNQLVVCKAHVQEAKDRRAKFEKSLMTYTGIGAVLGAIMVGASLFSSNAIEGILQSLVLFMFLVGVMAVLSLAQYFPAVAEKRPSGAAKKKRRR